MMRSILFSVFLTALFLVPPCSDVVGAENLKGIKGSDDRLTMASQEYPWSAVGRINTENGGHCTGVLVGSMLAVTAAHCLYDKRKRSFVPPSQVHFVAGYFRKDDAYTGGEVKYQETEYIGHSTTKSYFIPDTYQEGVQSTGKIAASDWALLLLKDPIGIKSGWFGVKLLDQISLEKLLNLKTPFVQAGYSKDKKQELTAHINCPFEGFARGLALIVHRCDAVPGDSGSPIFYFEDGLPVLIAIHVATTQKGLPTRGVAVPSISFIDDILGLGFGQPVLPPADELSPVKTTRKLLSLLGYPHGEDLGLAVRQFQELEGIDVTERIFYNLIGYLVSAVTRDR